MARLASISFTHEPVQSAASLAARGFSSFIDYRNRLTRDEKVATQLTTCVLSGCSFLASVIALYWFWRMKRLFRHKLIMLLIFADIGRSFWYFIFTSVALSGYPVSMSNGFCQVTGYLTQTAIEGADVAVLIIAVHTALLVFRPKPFQSTPGGLYPWRYLVFALAVIYPIVMSSLAFIQGRRAFIYQGLPVCNLPLRPFWYRLAISWIPRYVILCVIVGINVAIYIRADISSDINRFYERRISTFGRRPEKPVRPQKHQMPSLVFLSEPESVSFPKESPGKRESTAPSSRKMSDGTTLIGSPASVRCDSDASTFNPKSNRWNSLTTDVEHMSHSRLTHAINEETLQEEPGESHPKITREHADKKLSTHSTQRKGVRISHVFRLLHRRSAPTNTLTSTSSYPSRFGYRPSNAEPLGLAELRARRDTARRQLRLMFVYPLVYFCIWLVPFLNHLTQYSNAFAQHPVFPLTLLTWISIASMGMVDSLVFSLRERPWRHIPGSDGSFWGSFRFWTHCEGGVSAAERRESRVSEDTAERAGSPWAWRKRRSRRAEDEEEEEEGGVAAGEHDAYRGAGVQGPARGVAAEGSTLDAMHAWGFARRDSERQEAYWFDRRLSLALGQTGIEETGGGEDLRARDREGRGVHAAGSQLEEDDLRLEDE